MYAIRVEPDKEDGPILVVDLETDEVYYAVYARFSGLVEIKSLAGNDKPPPQFKQSRIWLEAEYVDF